MVPVTRNDRQESDPGNEVENKLLEIMCMNAGEYTET